MTNFAKLGSLLFICWAGETRRKPYFKSRKNIPGVRRHEKAGNLLGDQQLTIWWHLLELNILGWCSLVALQPRWRTSQKETHQHPPREGRLSCFSRAFWGRAERLWSQGGPRLPPACQVLSAICECCCWNAIWIRDCRKNVNWTTASYIIH